MSTATPDRIGSEALPYRRVDLRAVEAEPVAAHAGPGARERWGLRWSVVALAVALACAQAAVTILAIQFYGVWLTASMIPVATFAFIALLAGAANPAWGWLRDAGQGRWTALDAIRARLPRPLNRVEVTHLFAAMLISSGLSSYGLSQQLVPLIASPWNPSWNTPQRGWQGRLVPALNPSLYLADPEQARLFFDGVTADAQGRPLRPPRIDAPLSERLEFHRQVLLATPWAIWAEPLGAWLVLVLAAYLLFFAMSRLMLEHWIEREKLIFPLSRLAEAILPPPGNAPGSTPAGARTRLLPEFIRSPAFWLGFAISFGVHTVNALDLPDMHIPLGMAYWTVNNVVQGTVFEGVGGGNFNGMMFLVIFTAIGLAFFLPTEIAFSIWFYYLMGKLCLLVAVWWGYGRNGNDFPSDWLTRSNPVIAQGGGAMLLFAGVVLWRALRGHWQHPPRGLLPGQAPTRAERWRHALPVVGMVAALVIITAWVHWNRVPLLWAGVYVLVTTLMCLGLMRFVAEAGIYWFQTFVTFFHLNRALGLGRFLSPVVAGPMMPINSVLFLDVKCLLAGYLVTAGWLEREAAAGAPPTERPRLTRRSRVGVLAGLALAGVISIALSIHLAYAFGGDRMHHWPYRYAPQTFLDAGADLAATHPAFDAWGSAWFGAGALWCGLSMYVRQWLFGFPHPIGYAMLANPLTAHIWFACFIGWLCKSLVVRYGGKATFDRVRLGFVGLALGEILAIAFWLLASQLTGRTFPILDLNRYGA